MIAVTGITGHSGKFFLKQLVDNNYPGALRCLVRESSDTSALDASGLNIEKFRGSIDSDADLERFVSGADTVVHIAGIMKTPRLLADRACRRREACRPCAHHRYLLKI